MFSEMNGELNLAQGSCFSPMAAIHFGHVGGGGGVDRRDSSFVTEMTKNLPHRCTSATATKW